MTWTYANDFGLPRDQIRVIVGDTDPADPLITDEAIAFLATQDDSLFNQAAIVCDAIAAHFAREVNRSTGSHLQTISMSSNSQKCAAYTAKAAQLRALALALDAEAGTGFDWAEQVLTPAGAHERLLDQWLRRVS